MYLNFYQVRKTSEQVRGALPGLGIKMFGQSNTGDFFRLRFEEILSLIFRQSPCFFIPPVFFMLNETAHIWEQYKITFTILDSDYDKLNTNLLQNLNLKIGKELAQLSIKILSEISCQSSYLPNNPTSSDTLNSVFITKFYGCQPYRFKFSKFSNFDEIQDSEDRRGSLDHQNIEDDRHSLQHHHSGNRPRSRNISMNSNSNAQHAYNSNSNLSRNSNFRSSKSSVNSHPERMEVETRDSVGSNSQSNNNNNQRNLRPSLSSGIDAGKKFISNILFK